MRAGTSQLWAGLSFPGRAPTGGMPKLGTIAKVGQCDLRRLLISRGDGDGPMGGARRHEGPAARSDAGAQAVPTGRRTAGQPDAHTRYRPQGSSGPAWRSDPRSRVARGGGFASFLLLTLVVSAAVLIPSTVPEFGMTVVTAAQDAAAVEAALGLDRPRRRLIQERLRNKGFDPGAPDGMFGPRTRDAIRRWQEAQDAPATGYLDGEQAELLSASGALAPSGTEDVEPSPALDAAASALPDSTPQVAALLTDDGSPPVHAGTDGGSSARLPKPSVTLGNCPLRSSLTGIWCGSNGLSPTKPTAPPET